MSLRISSCFNKSGSTEQPNKIAQTSIINKSEIPENITTSIQALIGYGEVSKSTSTEPTVDITIILGKDYK